MGYNFHIKCISFPFVIASSVEPDEMPPFAKEHVKEALANKVLNVHTYFCVIESQIYMELMQDIFPPKTIKVY